MPFRLVDLSSQPPVLIPREPGLTGHVGTGHAITGPEVEGQLVVRAVPRTRQPDAWSADRAMPTAAAARRGVPSGTSVTDTAPVEGRIGPRRGARGARGAGVVASSALVLLAAFAVVLSGGSPKLASPLADAPLSALPSPVDGQLTVQAPGATTAPSSGTMPPGRASTSPDGGTPPAIAPNPPRSEPGSSWVAVTPAPRAGMSPSAAPPYASTPTPGPVGSPVASPPQGWVPWPTPYQPPPTPTPPPLPTPEPSAAPEPSATPTPEPSATPTPEPSATPAPTDPPAPATEPPPSTP